MGLQQRESVQSEMSNAVLNSWYKIFQIEKQNEPKQNQFRGKEKEGKKQREEKREMEREKEREKGMEVKGMKTQISCVIMKQFFFSILDSYDCRSLHLCRPLYSFYSLSLYLSGPVLLTLPLSIYLSAYHLRFSLLRCANVSKQFPL